MVQGLGEFNKRWGAIPAVVRKAAQDALEKQAQSLVTDMKQVAPKDTGSLADSIDWIWSPESGHIRVKVTAGGNAMQSKKKKAQGYKYRSLSHIKKGAFELYYPKTFVHDYARYVEFGTKKMAARPFFFPTYRARRRKIKSAVTRAISKAIKGI